MNKVVSEEDLNSIIKYGRFRHANPFKLGRKFGSTIENNARIAVFLDQIDKGKSFKQASFKVKEFLFNANKIFCCNGVRF